MIRRILIKIGSNSILVYQKIFERNKIKKDNKKQSIKTQTLDEIIKTNKKENKRKVKIKFIVIFLVIIIPLLFLRNNELILEFFLAVILIILFKKYLPNIRREKRKKEILQKLPYALRQMSTQLKAGMGLYDSMKSVSESNYGALSEEFGITLNEIQYGTNYNEAFKKLAERIGLKSIDKLVSQIIRTLNNGGNLADTLNTLADENSYNMKIKYKEYSEKLNAIMLLYMFIAVLLPVILFILIIAATTVMGSIIKPEMLLILYLIFFPMIIVFMIIFIKRLEPNIS